MHFITQTAFLKPIYDRYEFITQSNFSKIANFNITS